MYERMLDKQNMPDEENFFAYCGDSGEMCRKLDKVLTNELNLERIIRFPYGNSYGWSMKYTKKGKLICDIFAENGAFTVMLRMTNTQFASLSDKICEYTAEYIKNKYPCNDGGWIHYRVTEQRHYEDALAMLMVKAGIKPENV